MWRVDVILVFCIPLVDSSLYIPNWIRFEKPTFDTRPWCISGNSIQKFPREFSQKYFKRIYQGFSKDYRLETLYTTVTQSPESESVSSKNVTRESQETIRPVRFNNEDRSPVADKDHVVVVVVVVGQVAKTRRVKFCVYG